MLLLWFDGRLRYNEKKTQKNKISFYAFSECFVWFLPLSLYLSVSPPPHIHTLIVSVVWQAMRTNQSSQQNGQQQLRLRLRLRLRLGVWSTPPPYSDSACLINSQTIDMLSGKLRHWHANVSGCRLQKRQIVSASTSTSTSPFPLTLGLFKAPPPHRSWSYSRTGIVYKVI